MDHTPSTIAHALDTLEAFQFGSREFSARELHEMLDIPRATQYRILRVLESRGYLRRDRHTGRYKIGYKVLQLAALAQEQTELIEVAEPILHAMWTRTRETALLAVLDGVEVVFLRVLDSPAPHRFVLRMGMRAPGYCLASGLAILAHEPEEVIARVVAAGFRRFTQQTVGSAGELRARLAEVRRTGYAVNRSEWRESGCAVAAPVFDYRGRVMAAIGLSGPNDRLTPGRIPAVAGAALWGAGELSWRLGGGFPRPGAGYASPGLQAASPSPDG